MTKEIYALHIGVEGKAEALQSCLLKEASLSVDQLSLAAQSGLVDISVAVGTLEPNARKLLHGMRISSQQAADLVRAGFAGLRGAGQVVQTGFIGLRSAAGSYNRNPKFSNKRPMRRSSR